jgi:uncharacterized membrane protein YeaQ/YmgE (transglycosylase-associated protein family)
MGIIAFLVFGLVVGLIARAVMPGTQRTGFLATSLLGVAGSLLGGVLGTMLFGGHWDRPLAAGWIGSILGALLLLALAGRSRWARSTW